MEVSAGNNQSMDEHYGMLTRDAAGQGVKAKPVNIVMRTIRRWINEGLLANGELIPSIRTIAGQLDCTNYAVDKALQMLAREGWINKSGRAYMVARKTSPGSNSTLSNTIAVLINESKMPVPGQTTTGTLWEIVYQAFQSISQHARNCLRIDPELMSADELVRLIYDRPQGVIAFREAMLHFTSYGILSELARSGIPLVVYGYDAQLQMYDSVRSDLEAGTYMLTRHLIEQGHKRILRYWCLRSDQSQNPPWLADRDAGYEKAMQEAALEPMPALRCADLPFPVSSKSKFDMKVAYATGQLTKYINEYGQIDAVMAITDEVCFQLAAACEAMKLTPQRDVVIAGYDNYWQGCPENQYYSQPPLTVTVDTQTGIMGTELAGLLFDRIEGKLDSGPQMRVIEPRLIITSDT